ncbi:hypothetical protein X777_04590 [Ooceraea biroi]|uniref:Uncharacterized protein n=1 Tax=Ooceraea biroi TaxID=2015173 RepID=A0A026X4C5_OOCBI|nr:hypothetical protein X777_04590 [Ooceraea biroi]
MICDSSLPQWATTLARDNKGNMKIAHAIRGSHGYLKWFKLFTSAKPLRRLEV